jgi:hypothetical protein
MSDLGDDHDQASSAALSNAISGFAYKNGAPRRSPRHAPQPSSATLAAQPESQATSDAPSPMKKRKPESEKSGAAPKPKKRKPKAERGPETYAHLNFVTDYLSEGLDGKF